MSSEGTTLLEDDDLDAELAAMPVPPGTETHEEFLESLRQSIAEVKSGVPGLSVEEAFANVDAELRKLAESGKFKP